MAVFARTRIERQPVRGWDPLDSRQYIVPFAIASLDDLPGDFLLSNLPDFHCGLFLPRRDPDKSGRSTYPPRILLLTDSALLILTHPSDGAPPIHIDLVDIRSLETGNMLLLGWMDIVAISARHRVEYNTRCFQPTEAFRRELQRAVFRSTAKQFQPAAHFGDDFDDIKFSRAGDSELNTREDVVLSFLSLPRRLSRRRWLIQGEVWQPGDFVICTDRRFIWITDRYRGLCERYGRVIRSARLEDFRHADVRSAEQQATLSVRFDNDQWDVSIPAVLGAAAVGFAGAVNRTFGDPVD